MGEHYDRLTGSLRAGCEGLGVQCAVFWIGQAVNAWGRFELRIVDVANVVTTVAPSQTLLTNKSK